MCLWKDTIVGQFGSTVYGKMRLLISPEQQPRGPRVFHMARGTMPHARTEKQSSKARHVCEVENKLSYSPSANRQIWRDNTRQAHLSKYNI